MPRLIEYLRSQFLSHPLWGFKDPRTIRLLPFWQSALRRLDVDESYLVVLRNPRSVASSLFQRQGMIPVTAHLLWLAYMVPNLGRIANRPFVVSDYDMVMADPRRQLERIARCLRLPLEAPKNPVSNSSPARFSIRHCVIVTSTCPTLNWISIFHFSLEKPICGSIGSRPIEPQPIRLDFGRLGKATARPLRD